MYKRYAEYPIRARCRMGRRQGKRPPCPLRKRIGLLQSTEAADPAEEPARLLVGAYGEHAEVYIPAGPGELLPAPVMLNAERWD